MHAVSHLVGQEARKKEWQTETSEYKVSRSGLLNRNKEVRTQEHLRTHGMRATFSGPDIACCVPSPFCRSLKRIGVPDGWISLLQKAWFDLADGNGEWLNTIYFVNSFNSFSWYVRWQLRIVNEDCWTLSCFTGSLCFCYFLFLLLP